MRASHTHTHTHAHAHMHMCATQLTDRSCASTCHVHSSHKSCVCYCLATCSCVPRCSAEASSLLSGQPTLQSGHSHTPSVRCRATWLRAQQIISCRTQTHDILCIRYKWIIYYKRIKILSAHWKIFEQVSMTTHIWPALTQRNSARFRRLRHPMEWHQRRLAPDRDSTQNPQASPPPPKSSWAQDADFKIELIKQTKQNRIVSLPSLPVDIS